MVLITVPNPDLDIRGKGGEGDRGWSLKKKLGGLRVSVWSKNKGEGRTPRAPPLEPPLAH